MKSPFMPDCCRISSPMLPKCVASKTSYWNKHLLRYDSIATNYCLGILRMHNGNCEGLMTSLLSSISKMSYNFMSRLLTTIAKIFYALRTRRSITIVRIFHGYNFFHIYYLHINIKHYLFQYVTSTISTMNVLQFVGISFYLATSIDILIRNVDFRLERKTLLNRLTSSE